MDHKEKRRWLIRYLLDEKPGYRNIEIPSDATEQKRLLRSLFNVRVPRPISDDFLKIHEDSASRDALRAGIIADYSAANDLSLTAFQDYGFDPVALPE